MKRIIVAGSAILLMAGCNPPPTETGKSTGAKNTPAGSTAGGVTSAGSVPTYSQGTASTSGDPTGAGSATAGAGSTTAGSPASQAPKPLPLSSLPATLHTAAFDYYGLGIEKTQNLVIKLGTGTYPGTRTVSLTKVDNGKATFVETQSGGPEGEVVGTLSLEPSGIFVEALSPYTLKTPHQLELPSDFKAGATWSSDEKIDASAGTTIEQAMTFKVVGPQKVSTAGGTFDSLYVVGTGKGSRNSEPISVTVKAWYAKGLGTVKVIEQITDSKKKVTSISTELDK